MLLRNLNEDNSVLIRNSPKKLSSMNFSLSSLMFYIHSPKHPQDPLYIILRFLLTYLIRSCSCLQLMDSAEVWLCHVGEKGLCGEKELLLVKAELRKIGESKFSELSS